MKSQTATSLLRLGAWCWPLHFLVLPADAQQWLDLAQKRQVLQSRIRELGPLPPAVWTNSRAIFIGNWDHLRGDVGGPMGNYAYTGNNGLEYFFLYRNAGVWSYAIEGNMGVNQHLNHFGLHELTVQPHPTRYYFVMDAQAYSIAGLRYQELSLLTRLTANGPILQYRFAPGQGYHLPFDFHPALTFDLAQNVEVPSFKVADYWFGPYWDFPQDPRLPPRPKNTRRQSTGALHVGPIHQRSTNVVWVEEGVYRPGFALQPGHSSPRLHTYMEQYFQAAWQADPVSGNVPRTVTPNWNGVGRINTAAGTPTGTLQDLYRLFTPNRFGKAIITTQPQENGHYGELPFYALGLLVDKNRDGALDTNDVTSAASPHVFWVNNDRDRAFYEARNLWDELDLDPAGEIPDAIYTTSWSRIPSLRDLEDYDRLHVRGLKELARDLPAGLGYSVKLHWRSVQWGSPGIFVFKASDATGTRSYLTDATTASAQIHPTLYPPSGSPGASALAQGWVYGGGGNASVMLDSDTAAADTDFFLYCGTSRGAGELAASVYRSGQLIGEVTTFIELRDVKELYERWTVGDANGGEPAINAVPVASGGLPATQFNDPAGSGRQYILFVHGWNMAPWEKDAFAETAFKRLYWQGYTNRFGAFRWPTTHGFTGDLLHITSETRDYDNGEFTAWRSAEGLRRRLVQLNQTYPGKVYVMAHSMGNVVAGEALALQAEQFGGGQIVNTYVASQAAVPLHCYNRTNQTPAVLIPFTYDHPLAAIPNFNYGPRTPNIYVNWLVPGRLSATRRVNFYNVNDYALAMPVWGFNQLLKPDNFGPPWYGYVTTSQGGLLPRILGGPPAAPPYFLLPPPCRSGVPVLTGVRQVPGYFFADRPFLGRKYFSFEHKLVDMYETVSYGAQAHSLTLGATVDTNALPNVLSLPSIWPPDTELDDQGRPHARHKWHSAQFRQNNMRQGAFWRALLDRRGLVIIDE